jgi:hypothetical protein
MMYDRIELESRAQRYAADRQLALGALGERLGFGVHGIVFATNRKSAIKIHGQEAAYRREREVYVRLQELGVEQVRGFSVPQLIGYDDVLLAIEMGIVTPPFVLDFAAAYLDGPPGFSEQVMIDWEAEKREQFEQHWPEVQAVLRALEELGIYQTDVSPNNVRFRD